MTNNASPIHSQSDITQTVLKDRIDSLFSSIKVAAFTTMLAASFYVFIHLDNHSLGSLLGWELLLLISFIFRFVMMKQYYRTSPTARKQKKWLYSFRLGVMLTSSIFGSISYLFYPTDSLQIQMVTTVLLTGMAAGALTVLAADTVSFTIYFLCLLAPLSIMSSRMSGHHQYSITILLALLWIYTILACKKLNLTFTSSRKLRYENLALVDQLQKDKHRLDNRLGRILNDSFYELYILHAETLACIQVNKGATQNLGFGRKELHGKNLIDIITSLDRDTFDKLVLPLRNGKSDSVIYEGHQRRKDGSTYPVEINLQLSTKEDPPVFVATTMDITERNEAAQKLRYQANYDQLTKLPNRHFMIPFIDKAFARGDRNHTKVAVLFMDINNFKDINDSLGHSTGDRLLTMVAERIGLTIRKTDTLARFGGDEFVIVLEELKQANQAENIIFKIINCFQEPFFARGQEINVSTCIGVSIYPDDGKSVDVLMQYADTAMYAAKKEKNQCMYHFFSQEMRESVDKQLSIKKRLQYALDNNELSVFYQPKVDINSNTIVGAEALLRWTNKDLGDVPPFIFIPVAEQYGLIENIGAWVMKEACIEASLWQKLTPANIHVAVNISPQQFRSNKLIEHVDSALRQSGLSTKLLELEITESLLMQDTGEPLKIIKELNSRNIKLSLDDFGTGYSALSYLKNFPLQVLKIDRSFILDILDDDLSKALVEAIIAMANSLKLDLVAEGVENLEQLEFLRKRKVEVVQGYLFSRPVPAQTFRVLLNQRFDTSTSTWVDQPQRIKPDKESVLMTVN